MANEQATTQGIAGDVKISLKEKFCYAIGDPACNVVFALTATLLTFFYTDYIGISAGTIGMIMLPLWHCGECCRYTLRLSAPT